MQQKVRILLVDDHALVREGLRTLLERRDGYLVVGEAGNGRDGVRMAAELRPDLVVMDIGLPDLNGIEATRLILANSSHIKVIGLSMHSDRRFVVEMLRAGACAYLLKQSAFSELDNAVQAALGGQTYLSPKVASSLVDTFVRRTQNMPDGGAFEVLSPRERQVLQLLAEGLTTKQIADRLGTSAKTVDAQRGQIMAKLDVHSIAELTRYAIREGLSPLE